jgi:hypothetical protein
MIWQETTNATEIVNEEKDVIAVIEITHQQLLTIQCISINIKTDIAMSISNSRNIYLLMKIYLRVTPFLLDPIQTIISKTTVTVVAPILLTIIPMGITQTLLSTLAP